jgi:predicted nuclease of predicted toxin-antitoxin system
MRELGLEAEHARNVGLRSAPDKDIAEYARKRKAILVTKDLEFGSPLVYPVHSHYGVLIVRLPHYFTAQQIAAAVKKFLSRVKPDILAGAITVLEPGRYRIRKIA